MHEKITMKIFKKILVSLITAFVTMTFVYSGYTIYAADQYKFEKVTNSKAIDFYHEEMNSFFNGKFAAAVKILNETGDDKGVNNPLLKSPCQASDFAAPGGAAVCKQACKNQTDNISPYCVSIQSMNIYLKYMMHLKSIQGTIDFGSLGGGAMRMTPVTDIVYQAIASRDAEIDKDIESSRRVLEATVATYNEFLTAYPIHKQYNLIINHLVKYKNKLKDLRYEMIQFPSTFIDTTSTKCS
jgi:hypothetical protein